MNCQTIPIFPHFSTSKKINAQFKKEKNQFNPKEKRKPVMGFDAIISLFLPFFFFLLHFFFTLFPFFPTPTIYGVVTLGGELLDSCGGVCPSDPLDGSSDDWRKPPPSSVVSPLFISSIILTT